MELIEVTSTEFEYSLARDRPRRQIRPPQRYDNFVAFALNMAESIDEQEPSSFHEAVNCDEASQWIGAMKEELESLHNTTPKLAFSGNYLVAILFLLVISSTN